MKAPTDAYIPITDTVIDRIPKMDGGLLSDTAAEQLRLRIQELLRTAQQQPLGTEVGMVCNMQGELLAAPMIGPPGEGQVRIPDQTEPYIAIHNHPDGRIFSHRDVYLFLQRADVKIATVVGNDGSVYTVAKMKNYRMFELFKEFRKTQKLLLAAIDENRIDLYLRLIEDFLKGGEKYGVSFERRGPQGS